MGWTPSALGGREFLILSTHGGIRAPDGTPIALGYHTGHWEVGLLMEAAAHAFKAAGAIPFAASCTDPCDGRSQGTPAMFDSLAYRNDAATIFRRLIRSLPTRSGVLGVATCDKGLPAMMMALASMSRSPLRPRAGRRHAPARRGRRRGAGADDWRPLHAWRAVAAGSGRPRLPRLRVPRRRLPVPRHGRDVAGRRRSARAVARPLRPGAIGTPDLARHGAPVRDGVDGARRRAASRRATSSPRPRCGTRWSRTPRSAARPTSSSTSRRSRTRRASAGRRWPTGPTSTAASRASSTRCRMARAITRRSRCFSPAASRR